MEFSNQIKDLREQLNKSMREISEDLEIPYRTWQDWEANRREPAQWTQNLLLEKLERMAKDMFTQEEIYELLAAEAMRTNKMGDETVTVKVLKDQFNKDLEYRPSLFWEDDGDFIIVTDVADQKIYTADRETGTFIDEVATIDEGIELIRQYEEKDIEDGTYEKDFYDIVDGEHNSLR